jgi:hypothetical protein
MFSTRNNIIGVIAIALFVLGWVLFISFGDTSTGAVISWVVCFAGFIAGMTWGITKGGNKKQ